MLLECHGNDDTNPNFKKEKTESLVITVKTRHVRMG